MLMVLFKPHNYLIVKSWQRLIIMSISWRKKISFVAIIWLCPVTQSINGRIGITFIFKILTTLMVIYFFVYPVFSVN